MRGREVEGALEKRQLWENSKISKIKRHSFKHINPVKLQYIMLKPPQLSCLLTISTEGHVCVITLRHTLAKVIRLHFMAAHFPAI